MKLFNNLNLEQKNRVEIIDDACGTYNRSRQTKLKSKMVKSSICDYSDGWIWNCEGDNKNH